ncbi:MAG: acyl-CoA dehydrogenase [Microthrixaceae bacterium]
MAIAISDDHVELGQVVADFLDKKAARTASRELLEADSEPMPAFWGEIASLGWLGLHLPEDVGGSGFGLMELLVVVEEMVRGLAPGPFVPTVIASAFLAESADQHGGRLPGLADGSIVGAVALDSDVTVTDGRATGSAVAVVGGGLAQVLVVLAGDDVLVIDAGADGVTLTAPSNLDPTRRSARVTLDSASVEVVSGAGSKLRDIAQLIYAAEAVGMARFCTDQASGYAKERMQFGRVIGTFQAVKHHCANMALALELATASVWDAARVGVSGGDEFSIASSMAAVLAMSAADQNAQLNIQVHGGIGFTWEHDAHMYLRRATVIESITGLEAAAERVTTLFGDGVRMSRSLDLPPEAEAIRDEVKAFIASLDGLDDEARAKALLDSGYSVPSWPKPWGREAGAVEQLVIEEEFKASGVAKPSYGITGWVILTLIQHATEDQIARWIRPALAQEVIWCQLFSEPDAGSDAAGVKTRATRVDGGWLINGQKVWTSGAHLSSFGLATVRTDPEASKHGGITTVVVDMHAKGVEVRPLRMTSGMSEFNEVFFDDVFVPDDDVVGSPGDGWTVARATLGNESVSIGGGESGMTVPPELLLGPLKDHPGRLAGGAGRVGRHIARSEAATSLNQRGVHRAVAGGGPGPEGAVTKLALTENIHESAAILVALAGPDGAYLDGPGAISGMLALMHRALSIAGGTSEIKRNQIGERLLGLPRDPLIN